MLERKRLKNYTIYAIGEIALVIISILIALGINNWNQNKQLQKDNTELQKKVLIQISKDIGSIEAFKKDIDTLNQAYRKVLGRDYDKNKVNEDGVFSTILFEVNTLSLDRHLINLIDNAKLDESKASQEIIDINSNYKLYLKNIDDVEQIIFKRIIDNLSEIENSQEWYSELITDLVCKNDCINYLLYDESHKSRIASLRFLYVNAYGGVIDSFMDELKTAQQDLEMVMIR